MSSRTVGSKIILFACVHNAGRSQMAAAFFNAMVEPGLAKAISAGTEPISEIHPEVIQVMKEMGLDLSGKKPKKLTEDLAAQASLFITMGCGETCPMIPGLRRENWSLPDPKGSSLDQVRKIRDEIKSLVQKLLEQEGLGLKKII